MIEADTLVIQPLRARAPSAAVFRAATSHLVSIAMSIENSNAIKRLSCANLVQGYFFDIGPIESINNQTIP